METNVVYWCNVRVILGLHWGNVIRVILGLHWGNGKENGNYCSILV